LLRVCHRDNGASGRRIYLLSLPLVALAAVAVAVALLPAASSATTQSAPTNTALPQIVGTPQQDQAVSALNGTWTDSPSSFAYAWLRCPDDGGAADGSNCIVIPNATESGYQLHVADIGLTIRVVVTATNADGSAKAVSDATGIVTAAPVPPYGCPSGNGMLQIAQVSPPARLLVDHLQVTPNPVISSTTSISVRVHVSACNGRDVSGALIYVTPVPFNQFSIPPEAATGDGGWVTLSMNRLSGFPASSHQDLLVMFVRARKPGEPVLGGVSTRRLMAQRVDLTK
jgi:hypothetical protein